jgi:hypothetical protein
MNIILLWFSFLLGLFLLVALSGYVTLGLCVCVVYLRHCTSKALKTLSVVFMTHKQE